MLLPSELSLSPAPFHTLWKLSFLPCPGSSGPEVSGGGGQLPLRDGRCGYPSHLPPTRLALKSKMERKLGIYFLAPQEEKISPMAESGVRENYGESALGF